MVLERKNDQFWILYSTILAFKKENKTTDAHYTTRKGYKKIRNKDNPAEDMNLQNYSKHKNW